MNEKMKETFLQRLIVKIKKSARERQREREREKEKEREKDEKTFSSLFKSEKKT